MAKELSLNERIDRLYAGPAEEFIARRDALVKELKASKDTDDAAAVKAMRKPTAAAWAVNQLAHAARREVAKLLDVGEALRDAHEALADGKGDAGVRAATTKRRKLVADLTERAVGLLGAGGEAQRNPISNTLDAAVANPDAGTAVQAGRLVKELSAPSGFGADLVFATPPAAPRDSSSRRNERRAARAAARDDSPALEPPTPTPRPMKRATEVRKADAARKASAAAATAEAERRTTEAQQAARHAAKARQELSRLRDELVTANARSKAADEKARLTQWAATTAQQAARDVDAEAT